MGTREREFFSLSSVRSPVAPHFYECSTCTDFYDDSFTYLSIPPIRRASDLLSTALYGAEYVHVVASPSDCLQLVDDLEQLQIESGAAPSEIWRPKIVYEPHPKNCRGEELGALREVLSKVHVLRYVETLPILPQRIRHTELYDKSLCGASIARTTKNSPLSFLILYRSLHHPTRQQLHSAKKSNHTSVHSCLQEASVQTEVEPSLYVQVLWVLVSGGGNIGIWRVKTSTTQERRGWRLIGYQRIGRKKRRERSGMSQVVSLVSRFGRVRAIVRRIDKVVHYTSGCSWELILGRPSSWPPFHKGRCARR